MLATRLTNVGQRAGGRIDGFRAGDVAEGDLPNRPLACQLPSCGEDRLPTLILVLGSAGTLELGSRCHSSRILASGELSERCCLI